MSTVSGGLVHEVPSDLAGALSQRKTTVDRWKVSRLSHAMSSFAGLKMEITGTDLFLRNFNS